MKHSPELIKTAKREVPDKRLKAAKDYDLTQVKDRILYLADILEGETPRPKPVSRVGFHMGYYRPAFAEDAGCGSACCIAGHIILLMGCSQNELTGMPLKRLTELAGSWLGLGKESADALFAGTCHSLEAVYATTPFQAATVLRHLAKTGEVDWSVADRAIELAESSDG